MVEVDHQWSTTFSADGHCSEYMPWSIAFERLGIEIMNDYDKLGEDILKSIKDASYFKEDNVTRDWIKKLSPEYGPRAEQAYALYDKMHREEYLEIEKLTLKNENEESTQRAQAMAQRAANAAQNAADPAMRDWQTLCRSMQVRLPGEEQHPENLWSQLPEVYRLI